MPTRRVVCPQSYGRPFWSAFVDGRFSFGALPYGVKESFVLTAVFEEVEGGAVQARVEELPEVITAAATREQAEVMLLDALREYVLSFGSHTREQPPSPKASRARLEITFRT